MPDGCFWRSMECEDRQGFRPPDEIEEDGNWIHDGEIRPYSDLWTNGQKEQVTGTVKKMLQCYRNIAQDF